MSFGEQEGKEGWDGLRSKPWSGLFIWLCFRCFAVLKAFLERVLLWSNNFFTLPSSDVSGQGCLHSAQACCTRGENRRLENLAKYFVAALTVTQD